MLSFSLWRLRRDEQKNKVFAQLHDDAIPCLGNRRPCHMHMHKQIDRQRDSKIQKDNFALLSLIQPYFINLSHSVRYIFSITTSFRSKFYCFHLSERRRGTNNVAWMALSIQAQFRTLACNFLFLQSCLIRGGCGVM